MDRTELSLYNWVNTPAGAEMVVGFSANSSKVMTYNGHRDARWSVSNIAPIPITPELLEKNNLKRKESANGKMVDWERAGICVRKYADEIYYRLFVGGTAINIPHFENVHTLADAVRDAECKYADNLPTEERIRLFVEAHPADKPNARYPAKDLYEWHHTLTGSCDAGRRAFARDHNIDIATATFTVGEFISLTRNAYGGDVIKQLAEHYV